MARYLLDASALYPLVLLLRETILDYIDMFAVLDLTIYEVGNALWKEFRRGRVRDIASASMLFEELFKNILVMRVEPKLNEILAMAVKENLTFYDASYLYMTRVHKMKLVTEDKDLLRFPEAINANTLINELKNITKS